MPKSLINCPNCRQPITAEIEQLFDAGASPDAKQKLLSGSYNLVQCSHCGYQGNYPTIIVYHDPVKELLLTFTPPMVMMPRADQERLIGSLINQAMKNLPPEQRKGYFLNPQAALTMQGLVERILEADGITREMLQAQQDRLNMLQRLLTLSSDEARAEVIHQEDSLFDEQMIALLRRLLEAAEMSGDQAAAQELERLQGMILRETTLGQTLQQQAQEVEAALKDLQAAGNALTREKLLDLAIKARSEDYLHALVNFARAGMDYQFFQILSERIERARGDGRTRLVELRTKLLDWTRAIDEEIAAHVQEVRKLFEAILQADDVSSAMAQSLPYIDNYFLQELDQAMKAAQDQGDVERIARLEKMIAVLQQASQTSPLVGLIEELLNVPEDAQQAENWRAVLAANADKVTPDFLSALGGVLAQVQESNDTDMARRMGELNRVVLRYSMEQNLKSS